MPGPVTTEPMETLPVAGERFADRAHASTEVDRRTATFEIAVAPLWPALVRRLVLVIGDHHAAEDVAQDAYLRAYRAWDRFEGDDPRGWLYTIALRLAFNEQRRHRRLLAAVTRVRHRPWHEPADPDLRDALARLDPRARSALLLNAVDGYTQREVAGILGIPEGTVGRIVSEARVALRADLDRAS